jgi:hypothetical protein
MDIVKNNNMSTFQKKVSKFTQKALILDPGTSTIKLFTAVIDADVR